MAELAKITVPIDFHAFLDAAGHPVVRLNSDANGAEYPIDHPAIKALAVEQMNSCGSVSPLSVDTFIQLLAAKAYREGPKPVDGHSDPFSRDSLSVAVYLVATKLPGGRVTYENTLEFRHALVAAAAAEKLSTSDWTEAPQWFAHRLEKRAAAQQAFGVTLIHHGKRWTLSYDPPPEGNAREPQ